MKMVMKILLLCLFSFCMTASFALAQEDETAATEAEMYFASGTVAEISATQITISEYDFDAGQEIKVAYQVNAQTQFEGAAGVADIKAGDDVEIEYQMTGDQKVATRIEKYAPEADEEMTDENASRAVDEGVPAVNAEAPAAVNAEAEAAMNTDVPAVTTEAPAVVDAEVPAAAQ